MSFLIGVLEVVGEVFQLRFLLHVWGPHEEEM